MLDILIPPLLATVSLAGGLWLLGVFKRRPEQNHTAAKVMCASGVFSKSPYGGK